ncbi:hypothetical protein Y887_10485 [Xanthomonas pisi DSM 18956]|uniref:Uncharacterized protein n=1 Tax=Xanthomonas pisi TaxID=56457 RepID=A0A2S7CQK9_9XANT|nr:hypothetical protein Y887_10485 [Xanthomonas pisi DSM 18956]PPU63878.1 hypothetical protein XpiCFBP4643_22825 [Xanthomonas pisi]
MEWYETRELRSMAQDESLASDKKALIAEFQFQLTDAIERSYISAEQFLDLTADDCASNAEVVCRLKKIRDDVFGG